MSDEAKRLVGLARQRVSVERQTHWEGCEREHRECLIQRMADYIERAEARVRELDAALVAVRDCTDLEGWGSTVAASDLCDRIHDLTDSYAAALREMDEEDVFAALDLDPESFRTEGGAVNVNKLRAAIVHPGEYLPDGHWLRSALNDEDAARYRWLRVRINSLQLWPAEKALDAMIDAAINAKFDAARGSEHGR